MKKTWFLCLVFAMGCDSTSENGFSFINLAPFPVPICAAGVVVYNNEIYVFGGSNNYAGDTTYASIYKFDGTMWVPVDTMLNNQTWDGKLLLQNNVAYYVNGWPGVSASLQRYDFRTSQWTVLDTGNLDQNWGTTAQMVNNKIYHFAPDGQTDIFDIGTGTWTPGETNTFPSDQYSTLISAVYNGNIYLTGYGDSVLYKYTVTTGTFSVASQMPRPANGGAMVQHAGKLYFISGSSTDDAEYTDIIVYDIAGNSWSVSPMPLLSSFVFPGYTLHGNQIIVVGGIDPNGDGTTSVIVIEL